MTIKAPDLLNKAAQHMADRAKTYDKPEGERSMGKTIQAFNTITDKDLTEAEGWLLMQLLKDVRLFQRPGYHADSAEDCIAYSALMAEAKAAEYIGQIDKAKKFVDDRLNNIAPPIVYGSPATGVFKNDTPLGNGWLSWTGGAHCPVDLEARVSVKFKNGDEGTHIAKTFDWYGGINNIIAYKVIEND